MRLGYSNWSTLHSLVCPGLKSLPVKDLVSGVILAADLYAADGRLLLTEGTELSLAARSRINQYTDHVGIKEPVEIRVPI